MSTEAERNKQNRAEIRSTLEKLSEEGIKAMDVVLKELGAVSALD